MSKYLWKQWSVTNTGKGILHPELIWILPENTFIKWNYLFVNLDQLEISWPTEKLR